MLYIYYIIATINVYLRQCSTYAWTACVIFEPILMVKMFVSFIDLSIALAYIFAMVVSRGDARTGCSKADLLN